MARPCKSAKVLTDKSQTKAEIDARIEMENAIGGGADKLKAPSWLTDSQKKIFRDIVTALKPADILRNLDVHILAEFAWSLDMKIQVEKEMNNTPQLKYAKNALSALDKFTKTFFRCCNELSLSPQSRAKIANAAAAANDGTEELIRIIRGDFEDENKQK